MSNILGGGSLKWLMGELNNLEHIQEQTRGGAAHTSHSSSHGWGTGVPQGPRKATQLKNQSQTGQPKKRGKRGRFQTFMIVEHKVVRK